MGFINWVRRHLGNFDQQIENYGHPADNAPQPPRAERRPSPHPRPEPARRTAPEPIRQARHRLGEPPAPRPNRSQLRHDDDVTGAPMSSQPMFIDTPSERHDHRHHGHSGDHGHIRDDSGPAPHHGHTDHGSSTTHHGHDSGSYDSGSYGDGS